MKKIARLPPILMPCLLASLLGTGAISNAVTITVDGSADGTLSELAGNGTCDLREAIFAANSDSPGGECAGGDGADTIDFALEPYPTVIRVTQGTLVVSEALTVVGPGSGDLLLFNQSIGGLFLIDDQTPGDVKAVNIHDMSLGAGGGGSGSIILNRESLNMDGVSCSDASASEGSCIFNDTDGDLQISNSIFTGNRVAVGNEGGAISNRGSAIINNTEFRDNAAARGGAISNRGSLSVVGGLFVNNGRTIFSATPLTISDARFEDNGASGGAPSVLRCQGRIVCEIRNTEIVGNRGDRLFSIEWEATLQLIQSLIADNNPGTNTIPFLISVPPQSMLLVENSTIANNNLVTNTMVLEEDSATLTLRNSTIATSAPSPNTAILANLDSILIIEGSIVAGHANDLLTNEDPPFFVPSVTINDSILGTVNGTFSGDNNLLGVDPELGPLQDNGGPTLTMAISETSPAVDLIPVGQSGCGSTIVLDQRGEPRPMGPGCDAGAFEQRDIDLIFGSGFELPVDN